MSGLLAALSHYLAGLARPDRRKNMNKRALSGGLTAALLLFALSACSQGRGDSPVSHGGHGDDSPAAVTNFPDGFANIATKCVSDAPGFRAFVTTRNAAPVVLSDPSCK